MISPLKKGFSTLKAVETVCFLLVQLHASGFPKNLVMIRFSPILEVPTYPLTFYYYISAEHWLESK